MDFRVVVLRKRLIMMKAIAVLFLKAEAIEAIIFAGSGKLSWRSVLLHVFFKVLLISTTIRATTLDFL